MPNTSSFPLYPSHSSSQPVAGPSRTSREQHEADLALLRSYAKSSGQVSGKGKGKGKGRAYVPRTAADLPADEVLLGEAKKRMSARYSRDVAEYSEEELREFYFAMVQSGAEGGEVDAEERGGTRRISGGNEVRRIGSGALGSQRSWGRGWEGGMQGLEPRSGRIERLLQRALRRLSGTGDSSLLREGAAVPGAPGHAIQSLTAEQAGDAILAALKQALPDSSGSGSGEAANGVQVGLGLLRRTEWKGLLADRVRVCASFRSDTTVWSWWPETLPFPIFRNDGASAESEVELIQADTACRLLRTHADATVYGAVLVRRAICTGAGGSLGL